MKEIIFFLFLAFIFFLVSFFDFFLHFNFFFILVAELFAQTNHFLPFHQLFLSLLESSQQEKLRVDYLGLEYSRHVDQLLISERRYDKNQEISKSKNRLDGST